MMRSTSVVGRQLAALDAAVQDEACRRLAVAEVVVERRAQLLVVAAGLDEVRQRVGAAAGREVLDDGVHVGEQVVAHAALVGHGDRRRHHPQRVEDERFLGVPPAVDRRLADTGPLGEQVHRQPGDADLGEQLERGREDRLVGIGPAGRPALGRSGSSVGA